MKLVESKEFEQAAGLHGTIGGEGLASLLMRLLSINQINHAYARLSALQGQEFLAQLLNSLEIRYEVSPEDLSRIPASGPFIAVANHPYGGIDGIILLKLMLERRPDYRMMANFLLRRIAPIREYIHPVDPFEGQRQVPASLAGLKQSIAHLEQGGCLGIFPAGEVSSLRWNERPKGVTDRQWSPSIIRFIKRAGVPVVPIYFHGTNSHLFHLLGLIHPMLRTVKLPSELLNKRNKVVRLRIGTPIPVQEQEEFNDIGRFGRYLRLRTYALRSSMEVRSFFIRRPGSARRQQPIINPIPQAILEAEINEIRGEHLLFSSKNYSVFCAPSLRIPHVMAELGRLREITFREVGEGTNYNMDIDEYDLYYHQLFIWHHEAQAIVGAYRVAKGNEVMERYGKSGFYIHSLFKLSDALNPLLAQSLELGRSFVVKEYQRKPFPLFLLWKGILYFLLKNPEYRYLIGPVSISNRFTSLSKGLIVKFITEHHYDSELARLVKPRNRYRIRISGNDSDLLLGESNDFTQLDQLIQGIEPDDYRVPVLLKKYIKLNGKIIGFNVDPKFNNAIDGLLILDLFNIPMDTIATLAKEVNDHTLMERFQQIHRSPSP